MKAKSLYLQVEKLHQSLTKLDSTIAAVSQVLDEGRHLDVLLARERMLTQIHELKALRGLLQPQEDDRFMFTPPDQVGLTAFAFFYFDHASVPSDHASSSKRKYFSKNNE